MADAPPSNLRPIRPIKRFAFVEEVLPLVAEAAGQNGHAHTSASSGPKHGAAVHGAAVHGAAAQAKPPTVILHHPKIKVWYDAFIPPIIPENPDLTAPVPNQPGKFMLTPGRLVQAPIRAPILTHPSRLYGYNTNDRSFSSNFDIGLKNSKLHVSAVIDTEARAFKVLGPTTNIHETIQYDRLTGDVLERRHGYIKGYGLNDIWHHFRSDRGLGIYTLLLGASSFDPIFHVFDWEGHSYVPDIDIEGTFTVDVWDRTVRFVGAREPFPDHEMYFSVDDGPTHILFTEAHTPGDTPFNLYGYANIPVDVTVGWGAGEAKDAGQVLSAAEASSIEKARGAEKAKKIEQDRIDKAMAEKYLETR